MTQTAFDISTAKQISLGAGTHAEPKYSNESLPTVTIPEGLNSEEADTLVRAMEFLCVLISFHDEIYAGEPDSAGNSRERGYILPPQ